jgi:hypothetical protein
MADDAIIRAEQQVAYAYMRADALPWPERVRTAVAALLGFLDEEPTLTGALFEVSPREDPLLAGRRAHLLERLGLYVDADGFGADGSLRVPGLSADQMLGACAIAIETHLLRNDPRPLRSLTGMLTGLIVQPYLGPHAALQQMQDTPQSAPGSTTTAAAATAATTAATAAPFNAPRGADSGRQQGEHS